MRRNLDLLAERRVRLPRSEALAELRADIVRAAYVEGDFVLADGLRTNYYFDKYLFETRPAILRRLGRFLADLVPREAERLAAPALGAVALGTAVSLELGLPLVIVRLDREEGSTRTIPGERGGRTRTPSSLRARQARGCGRAFLGGLRRLPTSFYPGGTRPCLTPC